MKETTEITALSQRQPALQNMSSHQQPFPEKLLILFLKTGIFTGLPLQFIRVTPIVLQSLGMVPQEKKKRFRLKIILAEIFFFVTVGPQQDVKA